MLDYNTYFYFENGKSSSFKVVPEDINKMNTRKYWSDRFEKHLANSAKKLTDTLITKDKFMYLYDIKSISRDISFTSDILSSIYTGFEVEVFIIKEIIIDDGTEKDFYNIYLSEYHYRELKGQFIFKTFYYNRKIRNDIELKKMASGNLVENKKISAHKPLTEEELEILGRFKYENIDMSISYLQSRILRKKEIEDETIDMEKYSAQVSTIIDVINNSQIDCPLKIADNVVLTKKNGYSPKQESLYDKTATLITFEEGDNDNLELYYEPNFGNNNLCYVYFKDSDIHISFNTSIGGFAYLYLIFKDNILSFKDEKNEDFAFPDFDLLDDKNFRLLHNSIHSKSS